MANTMDVLATEYSFEFDKIRQNAMIMSFHQYGALRLNYPDNVDAIESLKMRLEKYDQTGNREFLADVANMAMIEFMYPKHPKAHYRSTDNNESCGLYGMSVKEAERFKEQH